MAEAQHFQFGFDLVRLVELAFDGELAKARDEAKFIPGMPVAIASSPRILKQRLVDNREHFFAHHQKVRGKSLRQYW